MGEAGHCLTEGCKRGMNVELQEWNCAFWVPCYSFVSSCCMWKDVEFLKKCASLYPVNGNPSRECFLPWSFPFCHFTMIMPQS